MKTWRCKPWAQAEGVTWSERAIQRDTFSQEQCEVCPAELCPNIRATRAFSDPQTQTSQAEDHNQITKLHLGFATPSAGPRQVLLSSNYSLPPRFLGSLREKCWQTQLPSFWLWWWWTEWQSKGWSQEQKQNRCKICAAIWTPGKYGSSSTYPLRHLNLECHRFLQSEYGTSTHKIITQYPQPHIISYSPGFAENSFWLKTRH